MSDVEARLGRLEGKLDLALELLKEQREHRDADRAHAAGERGALESRVRALETETAKHVGLAAGVAAAVSLAERWLVAKLGGAA